jgi:hypothetical protein
MAHLQITCTGLGLSSIDENVQCSHKKFRLWLHRNLTVPLKNQKLLLSHEMVRGRLIFAIWVVDQHQSSIISGIPLL